MAALMFVTLGLNTLIELLIFGTMLQGVTQALVLSLHFVLPTILAAAALAYPFRTDQNASTSARQFHSDGVDVAAGAGMAVISGDLLRIRNDGRSHRCPNLQRGCSPVCGYPPLTRSFVRNSFAAQFS